MVKSLLQVSQLKVNLGDFNLRDISFEALSKHILGVVGENGSGKTSLLKSILGIYKLTGGDVQFNKNRVGVAFDEIPFPKKLTVNELATVFDRLITDWQPQTFRDYLAAFKLPRTIPLEKFSKGMKMQLNVAVTLSHQASLLLFDEVTSGLDPIVRKTVLNAIQEYVNDHEAAAVMTTHNLADVSQICTELILLDNGQLIFKRLVAQSDNAETLEKEFVKAVDDWGQSA